MRTLTFVAVLGVVVALTVKILSDLDFNKVAYNHSPGKCQYIEGIDTHGSEDLILLSNGMALISSGVDIPVSIVKFSPGKIYLFDPSNENAKAEALSIKIEGQGFKADDFYPVGITAWEEKGETTVYVLNSKTKQVHVFQLRIKEKTLVFKKSLEHPQISNPNNLIAVGRDQFYVSNFVYYTNPVGMVLEFTQKLPFGTVWYYDGAKFEKVLDGLRGPNGIAVSKSKKFLYLSTHFEEAVRVYRIESTLNLTLINTVDLYTGVDNINVDARGHVLVGCHPIAYRNVRMMLDSSTYDAPSQVLKLVFAEDHRSIQQVEEIYSNDGKQLSGGTVAALTKDGKKMLIGSLMHKTLICQVGQ